METQLNAQRRPSRRERKKPSESSQFRPSSANHQQQDENECHKIEKTRTKRVLQVIFVSQCDHRRKTKARI